MAYGDINDKIQVSYEIILRTWEDWILEASEGFMGVLLDMIDRIEICGPVRWSSSDSKLTIAHWLGEEGRS